MTRLSKGYIAQPYACFPRFPNRGEGGFRGPAFAAGGCWPREIFHRPPRYGNGARRTIAREDRPPPVRPSADCRSRSRLIRASAVGHLARSEKCQKGHHEKAWHLTLFDARRFIEISATRGAQVPYTGPHRGIT